MKTTRTFLTALLLTLPAFITPASAPVPDPLSFTLPASPGKTRQLTTPDQMPEGLAKSD